MPSTTMRVIHIPTPGGPEALVPGQRPIPAVEPEEVLIKVAAAGINRPDSLQRQGNYPPPPGASEIPGLEVSGTVVDMGRSVTDRMLGEQVCALLTGGGYAEYANVDHQQCLPLPDGLDLVNAAAIPETFFTVWTNLFDRGQLASDEVALIHGGASGIGSTAIQLATALGARVFATAGTGDKLKFCESLGAERAINYKTEDFAATLREILGKRGVDVILDIAGASSFTQNMSVLATEGRLVIVGLLGGSRSEINLSRLMLKRLTVTGSTLRSRSPEEKGFIRDALAEIVWPLLSEGTVKPIIQQTFPLEDAAQAHRLMDADATMGKLVLIVDPDQVAG
jgi:putative PIG3 family NAD(P)H quinone oxidoreductase